MKVILISIDTLRYDCVGYQSDKRALREYNLEGLLETPTLDSIAEKGVCFTNCLSTNTYTTASHASVFTGLLYPPLHGVRAHYQTKLSPGARTIATKDGPERAGRSLDKETVMVKLREMGYF